MSRPLPHPATAVILPSGHFQSLAKHVQGPVQVQAGLKWLKCPRSEVGVSPQSSGSQSHPRAVQVTLLLSQGLTRPTYPMDKDSATLHTLFGKDEPVSTKSGEPIRRV